MCSDLIALLGQKEKKKAKAREREMEPGKQGSRNEAAPGSRRQLSALLLAPSSGFPEACLHAASEWEGSLHEASFIFFGRRFGKPHQTARRNSLACGPGHLSHRNN